MNKEKTKVVILDNKTTVILDDKETGFSVGDYVEFWVDGLDNLMKKNVIINPE